MSEPLTHPYAFGLPTGRRLDEDTDDRFCRWRGLQRQHQPGTLWDLGHDDRDPRFYSGLHTPPVTAVPRIATALRATGELRP